MAYFFGQTILYISTILNFEKKLKVFRNSYLKKKFPFYKILLKILATENYTFKI